jgi:hypothetical protein
LKSAGFPPGGGKFTEPLAPAKFVGVFTPTEKTSGPLGAKLESISELTPSFGNSDPANVATSVP